LYILLAALIIITVLRGVKIVPQSEQYVIERFGRLHAVLNPGINMIVPFLDRAAHRISILERQLPTASQDAITKDNVLVQVDTSVFYRIIEPEKTVYRIRDVDAAIATTVAGLEPDTATAVAIKWTRWAGPSTTSMPRPPST
jgi:regulator of protease activity HflC (stomatin/prohibitin superfamily)